MNLCISRYWAKQVMSGTAVLVSGAPVSGTTYAVNKYFISGGGRWVVTTAGVSSGRTPSGTGPTFTDGSLVYTLMTAAITGGGTGTHTIAPKLYAARANKTPVFADDSYAYGTVPKLLHGYNFNYITQKTKSIPPLDPKYVAVPWQGSIMSFIPAMVYLPGEPNFFFIGAEGGGTVDERICYISSAAMASIYLPTDRGMAISARCIALSYLDRGDFYWRDERGQQVLVANHGPDKAGGTYPNMGPTSPQIYPGAANNSGTIGYSSNLRDWPGYGGGACGPGCESQGSAEASHDTNPFYGIYLTTGDPAFLDPMMEYGAVTFALPGSAFPQIRSAVVGGVQYDWAWALGTQSRAAGHALQIFAQTEWLVPSNHPAQPFFSSVMDDSANFGIPWMQANLTPLAQSLGIVPMIYPTWAPTQYPVNEVWMWSIIQVPMTHEAWKGNRPGFKTFLSTYWNNQWARLFDSDFGGSEKIIDVQWQIQGTTQTASTTGVSPFPMIPDSQFITTVPAQIQGATGGAYNPFPPPGNAFVQGLASQTSATPIYYTAPIPAGAYGAETYEALTMGSLAGIAQYTKILARVDALMASAGTPFNYQATAAQVPVGNRNALMWMAKSF
jgi:hypothetical protein